MTDCLLQKTDELDDVRLEKIGLGSNGEVFWLGDHCVIEGTGDMEQGELKIHKGNDIKPILERVEVFHGSLHHKAIEFSEETEKKGDLSSWFYVLVHIVCCSLRW